MASERPIWDEAPWRPEDTYGVGEGSGARCALSSCEEPAFSHGLCDAHYKFWRRKGTEALNLRAKRVPQTREEARALLYVRAIELADADDYAGACRLLEEAARFFGDPEYRRIYNKRIAAGAAARRRQARPTPPDKLRGKAAFKKKFIEENGVDAWVERQKTDHRKARERFIAAHGERAWKDRMKRYQQKWRANKKAKDGKAQRGDEGGRVAAGSSGVRDADGGAPSRA